MRNAPSDSNESSRKPEKRILSESKTNRDSDAAGDVRSQLETVVEGATPPAPDRAGNLKRSFAFAAAMVAATFAGDAAQAAQSSFAGAHTDAEVVVHTHKLSDYEIRDLFREASRTKDKDELKGIAHQFAQHFSWGVRTPDEFRSWPATVGQRNEIRGQEEGAFELIALYAPEDLFRVYDEFIKKAGTADGRYWELAKGFPLAQEIPMLDAVYKDYVEKHQIDPAVAAEQRSGYFGAMFFRDKKITYDEKQVRKLAVEKAAWLLGSGTKKK
jgi:hypothetical protein